MAGLASVCCAAVVSLAIACSAARAAEAEPPAVAEQRPPADQRPAAEPHAGAEPRPGKPVCLSAAETREEVKAHKLLEPFAALKFAAQQRKAEALSAKLCHSGDVFIYEITLLHRDGRLVHVQMDAGTGKLIAHAPHEREPREPPRELPQAHEKPQAPQQPQAPEQPLTPDQPVKN
jgi:hypothetical protein